MTINRRRTDSPQRVLRRRIRRETHLYLFPIDRLQYGCHDTAPFRAITRSDPCEASDRRWSGLGRHQRRKRERDHGRDFCVMFPERNGRILVPLRLARASHAGGCDGGRRWKFGRADSREAEAGARVARRVLDRDRHDTDSRNTLAMTSASNRWLDSMRSFYRQDKDTLLNQIKRSFCSPQW